MKTAARIGATFFFTLSFLIVGCVGPGSGGRAAFAQISADQRFSLEDLSGRTVSLDGLLKEKKAVLLNFWATWCPPCRAEIPDLIRLQEQYSARGFTVLGVNVGESQGKVSSFASKVGINYPVLLDGDQAVAEKYRVVGIPTSLLISSDGKILGEYHAATPELFSDVEKAVGA